MLEQVHRKNVRRSEWINTLTGNVRYIHLNEKLIEGEFYTQPTISSQNNVCTKHGKVKYVI